MIRGHSDLLNGQVEAEGEPGVHRWISVCVPLGKAPEVTAWLTQDGAAEAESDGEARGMVCEILPAEDTAR